LKFEIKLDSNAVDWFTKIAPDKLREARKKAVESAGIVWSDEAKSITREEDHIDTGLYVNSIGYSTGSPSKPIHELEEATNETVLLTGADVEYAATLEKRYGIMARAIDRGKDRMQKVAEEQVKGVLFGR